MHYPLSNLIYINKYDINFNKCLNFENNLQNYDGLLNK